MDDGDKSLRQMRRPLDLALLGSFPAPPTHIPRTNPPPSRPPSSPLPPLPAPRRPHDVRDDESGDNRLAALARVLSMADPIDPSSPRRTVFSPSSPRSPSPDIPAIISATPRPRANVCRHADLLDTAPSDDDDTRSWIDYDDFGRPLPARQFHLEGFESDASDDSSLDLHTPLPHLMMRHGLLSPHSKLITQPTARDSLVSLASTTTSKSARPLKDTRDTAKRRVRHRDGLLLRGGIGLTTGLGWSDSEDEDAPSALTRRISSLNLTNRSLVLSRSTNSLSSVPSRSSSGTSDYNASLPSRKSSSACARTLARSHSSTTSLRISDYTPEFDEFGQCKPRTPTTKLTIRTAGPIPENEELDRYASPDAMTGGARLNREKSLPPLPRSSVIRSMSAIRRNSENTAVVPDGRARSVSAAAASSSVRATITPSFLKTTRPLRLTSPTTPHSPLLAHRHRQQIPLDRPPVPVPTVSVDTLMPSPLLDTHGSLPSTPSTPSPVTPGVDRPRPRVGTGMTYRSSVPRVRPPSAVRSPVVVNQKPIAL